MTMHILALGKSEGGINVYTMIYINSSSSVISPTEFLSLTISISCSFPSGVSWLPLHTHDNHSHDGIFDSINDAIMRHVN